VVGEEHRDFRIRKPRQLGISNILCATIAHNKQARLNIVTAVKRTRNTRATVRRWEQAMRARRTNDEATRPFDHDPDRDPAGGRGALLNPRGVTPFRRVANAFKHRRGGGA
jgi:hypothetical protein